MTKSTLLRLFVCLTFIFAAFGSAATQTEDKGQAALVMGLMLFEKQHYSEAVPHLETAVKEMPDEPKLRFLLGFSLLGKSKQTSDTAEAKRLSDRALEQFREAKKLGLNDETNDSLIAILSGTPGPSGTRNYSENQEAEKLMNEGEGHFARANYKEAIKLFEKALTLDPKIYQAAVSTADSYLAMSELESAEKWYQKAIAIDPTRETAYRYSATPFMKQKKYDQARDRYIEAFITEPYSQMSPRGINQWAQVTGASLGHPEVELPEVNFDANAKATPKTDIKPDDRSMSPWLAYVATRESWKKDKFAKAFPKESKYRHSLQEEIEALRAAVKAAQEQKSPNKQFDLLAKLDTDGVLESFILLAKPDQGIAEDYAEYLKTNRPKLRLYVLNHVIRK